MLRSCPRRCGGRLASPPFIPPPAPQALQSSCIFSHSQISLEVSGSQGAGEGLRERLGPPVPKKSKEQPAQVSKRGRNAWKSGAGARPASRGLSAGGTSPCPQRGSRGIACRPPAFLVAMLAAGPPALQDRCRFASQSGEPGAFALRSEGLAGSCPGRAARSPPSRGGGGIWDPPARSSPRLGGG